MDGKGCCCTCITRFYVSWKYAKVWEQTRRSGVGGFLLVRSDGCPSWQGQELRLCLVLLLESEAVEGLRPGLRAPSYFGPRTA